MTRLVTLKALNDLDTWLAIILFTVAIVFAGANFTSVRSFRRKKVEYTQIIALTDWSLVLGMLLIVLRELMAVRIIPRFLGYQIVSWFWPLPFLFFFKNLGSWSHADRSGYQKPDNTGSV